MRKSNPKGTDLRSNRRPRKLWVDQGKEFYNEHMYKLFKFKKEDILKKDPVTGEYKNQIYSIFNSGKNPVIERFNRTLTNKLWKQFTVQGNQKWLGILQPMVDKYNNSAHRHHSLPLKKQMKSHG